MVRERRGAVFLPFLCSIEYTSDFRASTDIVEPFSVYPWGNLVTLASQAILSHFSAFSSFPHSFAYFFYFFPQLVFVFISLPVPRHGDTFWCIILYRQSDWQSVDRFRVTRLPLHPVDTSFPHRCFWKALLWKVDSWKWNFKFLPFTKPPWIFLEEILEEMRCPRGANSKRVTRNRS